MKKLIIILGILFSAAYVKAQEGLAFPFQGGKQVMMDYFKNNIHVTPEITKKAASGVVVFKFTADEKGAIKKIIVYYADDLLLTQPLIEALKQSDHKWIIPDKEKLHDFLIPFNINFNAPASATADAQKALYSFYTSRKPIISFDQVPLDMATLLPAVIVDYNLTTN